MPMQPGNDPKSPDQEPTTPREDNPSRVDESPRLPPADEDSSRGGLKGNSRGITRPDPSSTPKPSAAW
jgi:hypothetical protein